jgi:hypothetical protein
MGLGIWIAFKVIVASQEAVSFMRWQPWPLEVPCSQDISLWKENLLLD